MQEAPWYETEQVVVWNGKIGIRDFAMIDRVEADAQGRNAWLEDPYGMVGPFDFDALESQGRIDFAACTVMSLAQWRRDGQALIHAAMRHRQKQTERLFEELKRANARKRRHGSPSAQTGEREMRALLELPTEGVLEVRQIKTAYRRLVKTAHPDVGGNHELFVQITEARDILLERFC